MSSVWPGSVASDVNLYLAIDFPNSVTALNGAINSSVTSINVTNASNYPSSGGFILIDSELIYFTSTSGNTLTGCIRGQDGTLPASHLSNTLVNLVTVAEHHNSLKDEIIAIETSLNLTPSLALVSNVSGRVSVSSTTSTELGYVHGVTSSIQTQLSGKQASLGYTPVNKAGDSMSGSLTLLNQNPVVFEDTGINTVTVEAPTSISSSYTVKLPTAQGAASTFLQNDGSGNLSWQPTGASGVNSITGTTHQIIASSSTGAVTLSTPQNIDITSSPTFASEVLSNITNQLVLGTTNTVTISGVAPTASRTYTLFDAGANANVVLSVPYVSLTGQTTSIFTTTLFTPTVTGTYRVSIYIVDTAGTTFTLQGTIGWTDSAQAQAATTSTLTNTTNGYLQSSFCIEAVSGNAVTYAVALTGTATYNVYVVSERLA